MQAMVFLNWRTEGKASFLLHLAVHVFKRNKKNQVLLELYTHYCHFVTRCVSWTDIVIFYSFVSKR